MTRFITNTEKSRTIDSQHDLLRIANWSTEFTREEMQEMVDSGVAGAHESLMRSYQILRKVKQLLALKTPVEVIEELIALMESGGQLPERWHSSAGELEK